MRSSVAPLLLYPYRQLPVSQLSPCGVEVSAEELVSARWEPSPRGYTESSWNGCRRRRLLPLRDTDLQWGNGDCWSRRLSQTEHESQERPWHMMDTNAGREAASTHSSASPLSSLCARYPSPTALWRWDKTPGEGGGEERRWCSDRCGSRLNSGLRCKVWPLMFSEIFRDIGGFKVSVIGWSYRKTWYAGGKKERKKTRTLLESHVPLSRGSRGQAGRQLKTIARNERWHEMKGK